jgi:hypothetical protein
VPHVHSVIWTPESISEEEIRDLWLRCTKESDDPEAVLHAVKLRPEVASSPRWIAYLCAHGAAENRGQLGWKGKQWGIIGRERFVHRPVQEIEVTAMTARWFARLLRRWAFSRYGVRVFTSERGFQRAMDGAAFPLLLKAAQTLGGTIPF